MGLKTIICACFSLLVCLLNVFGLIMQVFIKSANHKRAYSKVLKVHPRLLFHLFLVLSSSTNFTMNKCEKIYLHPALRFELHTSRPEASPPYHLMYTLTADIDHVPVCTNQTSLTSKLRSRCRRSNV